mgnify:CR=1 FL=1
MKVLVCDPISQTGIEHLQQQNGLETIVLDRCHSEEELLPIMKDVSAMAVRSETKVTKTILEAAPEMRIVGRAGARPGERPPARPRRPRRARRQRPSRSRRRAAREGRGAGIRGL